MFLGRQKNFELYILGLYFYKHFLLINAILYILFNHFGKNFETNKNIPERLIYKFFLSILLVKNDIKLNIYSQSWCLGHG